jgi:HlyD family secretion protein
LTGPADADIEASCCSRILAPADGVVLEIDTISERPVTAGTRLLSIGDPQRLEIVADLLSADAVRLPPNARASVERWGGTPLEARMIRMEPTGRTQISALGIEEQRVDVVFEFTSPPEEFTRLGHGFAVFLRVIETEVEDTLLVPLSATFRYADGWAAFRVVGDRVERVPIELGQSNARLVSVSAGLEAGDRVVIHPNEALEDGSLIAERVTY